MHRSAPLRPARPADLPFLLHLQNREREALGFLPRAALAEKIDLRRIHLVLENGDPAGYLCHGTFNTPEIRIFQAAIDYDARRQHLGLALLRNLQRRALANHPAHPCAISLRCRQSLPANAFWQAAGFQLAAIEPAGRRRDSILNVWVKPLRGPLPTLHSRIHPCPRCGNLTPGSWAPSPSSRPSPLPRRLPLCLPCALRLQAPTPFCETNPRASPSLSSSSVHTAARQVL